MLNEQAFSKYMEMYRKHYGRDRMSSDTMRLWFSRLKMIPTKEFGAVFGDLLGAEKFPFGWKALYQAWQDKYPQHKALRQSAKWVKSEQDNPSLRFMREAISEARTSSKS